MLLFFFLRYFDLNRNKISGTIPTWLQDIESLQFLSLSQNLFMGIFPNDFFRNLYNLEHYDISYNSFGGEVEVFSITNLTHIKHFDISHNRFQTLLSENSNFALTGLESLTYLSLANNLFSTTNLPHQFLCQLTNLEYLYLSNSTFFEKIPDVIFLRPLSKIHQIVVIYLIKCRKNESKKQQHKNVFSKFCKIKSN